MFYEGISSVERGPVLELYFSSEQLSFRSLKVSGMYLKEKFPCPSLYTNVSLAFDDVPLLAALYDPSEKKM